MPNQSVKLTPSEAALIRSRINEKKDFGKIVADKVYTPSDTAIENFQTLNRERSTDVIVDLASNVTGRITTIEDNYADRDEIREIAEEAALILG